MRPDPHSDQAGAESEYGDDTGFAAEATRTSDPDSGPAGAPDETNTADDSNTADETAALTTEAADADDIGAGGD